MRTAVIAMAALAAGHPAAALAQVDPWGVLDPYRAPAPVETQPLPPADAPADPIYELPQGGTLAPNSSGTVVENPPEEPARRIENPIAVFSGLDKITGRITSFDAYVDETVQFGALQVTPRACYSAPTDETPKTDTFVEVDEITLERDIRRIFTGWMFADSPGLNAVEHPIYDVWLRECKSSSDVPPAAG